MSTSGYKYRFAIQSQPDGTKNAYGEPSGGWATVTHRYGELLALGGREAINAKIAQVTTTHRVKFHERYVGLSSRHRLTFVRDGATRTLQVDSVADTVGGRNHGQELMCTEVDFGA